MNKKNASVVVVALAWGLTSLVATAQPRPDDRRGPAPHMQQGPQGQPGGPQGQRPGGASHMQGGPQVQGHGPQIHGGQGVQPQHPHGMPPGQAKRMGAGPQGNWVKGSRMPPQYRSHQYVVNDWRGHGLKSPPRGYNWVQYGGDYLLVAIATGVITQLILGY